MKFKTLQENLRRVLWQRIAEGELTGLGLAAQTGFQQAHISNFLNRKRGLSQEGMDRVLKVQHLSILDLLDPAEINMRATILPPGKDEFQDVLLVEGEVAAAKARIMSMNVNDILKFKKTFLRALRPEMETARERWERFILIKIDAREGMSMHPRLLPGAIVLIDRHYNSLKPYRKGESNMYAVNNHGAFTVKYVEVAGDQMVLRPHNQAYPVTVMRLPKGAKPADYLIGRVCHVGIET
ncbi:MAG: S24 family peptidase [Terriglobales bacterium]